LPPTVINQHSPFALAALLAATCAPTMVLAQPATEWQPQLVALAESGNRNIPNYRFDATHTAGGHFQITDTNWLHYAPRLDIDIGKWPNAMSAPEQLQGQVAGLMYAETGYMPWVPYNARLRRDFSNVRVLSAAADPNSPPGRSGNVPPTSGARSPPASEAKPPDWDVFPDNQPSSQQTSDQTGDYHAQD
jgi:hypothetical protein